MTHLPASLNKTLTMEYQASGDQDLTISEQSQTTTPNKY